MRNFILIIVISLLLPFLAFAGSSVTATIDSDEAAGTWTVAFEPYFHNQPSGGFMNISIYGSTWVATVTLQRSFDGGSTWYDLSPTFTANSQRALIDNEDGVQYRIGVKNGDFTSGSVGVRLSN